MISTHAALSTWEINIFRVYINEFCFAFIYSGLMLFLGYFHKAPCQPPWSNLYGGARWLTLLVGHPD